MADLVTPGFGTRRTGRNNGSNIPPVNPNTGNFIAPDPVPPKERIDATAASASSIKTYTYPDDKMKYFLDIGIGEYGQGSFIGDVSTVGGGAFARRSLSIDTNIRLPIPEQVQDQQTADWVEENILKDIFGTAASLVAAVTAARIQSVGAGITALAGAAFVGGAAQAASIGARLSGIAPNQMITVLFSGPKYKQHTFSWVFSPQTPGEAEQLRLIIATLNNRMAPGIYKAVFWSFPSLFQLKFCPDVGVPQNTYMFDFKPAVLVNAAFDYAGGHVPSFRRKDGATNNKNPPQAIRMTLQFLEIEYWLNGDFGSAGARV